MLHHPLLSKYFRVLRVGDLVPAEYRESGVETYYNAETGWTNLEQAWRIDEFALDPTRADAGDRRDRHATATRSRTRS